MENLDRLVELITDRLVENLRLEADHSAKSSVYLVGKEGAVRDLLLNQGCRLVDQVDEADYLVIDNLPVDSFLRIASLCPIDPVESSVLTALLSGKKALALLETFNIEKYKRSANPLLYRDLLQQKTKLEKYGLHFYECAELLRKLTAEGQESPAQSCPFEKKEVASKSKLITEDKLRAMNLSEGDEFQISKGMIVTALAKDYLKRHKIKIVK